MICGTVAPAIARSQTHDAKRVKEELGEHRDILEACYEENRKDLPKAIRFNVSKILGEKPE